MGQVSTKGVLRKSHGLACGPGGPAALFSKTKLPFTTISSFLVACSNLLKGLRKKDLRFQQAGPLFHVTNSKIGLLKATTSPR